MPSTAETVAIVERYVAAFNSGDADAVTALFAADAVIEDPVGVVAASGSEEIRGFYSPVIVGTGATMARTGPIRANAADVAFPIHVSSIHGGQRLELDVIDVFKIDDAGKIASMKAYFDPAEVAAQLSV